MKDTTRIHTKWVAMSNKGIGRICESLEKMQANGRIANLTYEKVKQFDSRYPALLVVFDYVVSENRGGRPSDIIDTLEDIKWGAYRPRAAKAVSQGLRARVTFEALGSVISSA